MLLPILASSLSLLPIATAPQMQCPPSGTPGPCHGAPQDVPAPNTIDYPIIVCRMPDHPTIPATYLFPDANNSSLYIGAGSDLWGILPDGTGVLLVDASVLAGNDNPSLVVPDHASVVDPTVSFDGKSIFFSLFLDPRVDDGAGLGGAARERVPKEPAHIYRVDVTSASSTSISVGTPVRLTHDDDIDVSLQAHADVPYHKIYDLAPVELPDGRILFLSNRSNVMNLSNSLPAMRFYRMHADGSNIEALENFTQASCEHPFVLMDGRVVWTHTHLAGRRGHTGDNPLMVANPDMSDFKTFAGAHYESTAWHFLTQLSPGATSTLGQGDIVSAAYYPGNNYGHGTLVRFPPHIPAGPNALHPISDDTIHGDQQWSVNNHFQRVNERLSTPWSLKSGSLATDENSPVFPNTSISAGKATMPSGAPGGNLLFVWSPGGVHGTARPDMKVAFAPGGMTAADQSNMYVIAETAGFHYLYPRPLVPYLDIYGIEKPAILPDTDNDGVHAMLPAGSPFGTDGTSSVWNRESRWSAAYADAEGPDPWDVNVDSDYRLKMAYRSVGQDTRPFVNSEIEAVQVVADMSHFYTGWGALANCPPPVSSTPSYKSHNNGGQVWGILGEVPVRKYDANQQVIPDPWTPGAPDSSFEVRIPAETPFHNRLIDANGLTLTSEQTWHSVRPGERKNNCGGCHAHSTSMTPFDFSLSHAGNPSSGYQVQDFALQTPILSKDPSGNEVFVADQQVNPWNGDTTPSLSRVKVVEWFRDVRPIVLSKCLPCHDSTTKAGNLDLGAQDAWDRLAFTVPPAPPIELGHPVHRDTQVTRWVRKHSAAQSLLIWRIYGQRLDGRTNAQRPTSDIDYDPSWTQMPPPGHPQLTFDEKRTFAMWIDLGCLVDLTATNPLGPSPFDDQMKPTLSIHGIEPGRTAPVPTSVTVGVYDLHSGVAPSSLSVKVNGMEQVQQSQLPVTDGDVRMVAFSPPLQAGQIYQIVIEVADKVGNVTRREIEMIPLDPVATSAIGPGSPGANGAIPLLEFTSDPRIGNAAFGARLHHTVPGLFAMSFMGYTLEVPPIHVSTNGFNYLHEPDTLVSGALDAQGDQFATVSLPNDIALTGLQLHFQGIVFDPAGETLFGTSINAALSNGMTATIGW